MTSPTLREALERAVALIRECRLADAAAARDPSAEGRWDRALDALCRAEPDLRAALAADVPTPSHEAGRRAGLEEAARAVIEDAEEFGILDGRSEDGGLVQTLAMRAAPIRALRTAIRNLAGDEGIGDG